MMPTKSRRENEECADVYVRIERKKAEMRATYLKTTELYTPEDIQGQAPSGNAKGGFCYSRW